jgi:hypothetical protein
MVSLLQNKNRTDPSKITIESSKETLDQFDFVFLIYCLSLFSWLIISGNKKELSQKKIKNNVKNNIKR